MAGCIGRSRSRRTRNGRPCRSTRTVYMLRLVPYLRGQRVHGRTLCCRKVVGAIADDGDVREVLVVVSSSLQLSKYSYRTARRIVSRYLPLGIREKGPHEVSPVINLPVVRQINVVDFLARPPNTVLGAGKMLAFASRKRSRRSK